MADTPENQSEYPQNAASKPGLGFPLTRAVALISLATGSVVDLAFGKYKGKGTGELGLLRQIVGSLSAGNVLVADRYYPNYSTVAMLLERGVDLVSISHHARTVDFTQGEVLGPKDHIVEWELPQWRGYLDAETYNALPPTVKVREFATEIEDRDGGKLEATFVTTITDRSIPQKEHSDLYWKRWNCEVDIRSIKHALHLDFIRCKTPSMVRKEIDLFHPQ